MTDPRFTNRDIVIYLTVMMTLDVIVWAAAYVVFGWLDIGGDYRIAVAGQVPVIGVVALWIAALLTDRKSQ